MADREERKIQASKHEALMKGAFAAETQAAVAATVVYEEGEGRELSIPAGFRVYRNRGDQRLSSLRPRIDTRRARLSSWIRPPSRALAVHTKTAHSAPNRLCAPRATCIRFCAASKKRIMIKTAITDAACFAPIVRHTFPKWCSSMTGPCARLMSWLFPSRCAFVPSKITAPSASAILLSQRASRPFCASPWQTNAKRLSAAHLPAEIWGMHRRR